MELSENDKMMFLLKVFLQQHKVGADWERLVEQDRSTFPRSVSRFPFLPLSSSSPIAKTQKKWN
jgi:hypothetical protein